MKKIILVLMMLGFTHSASAVVVDVADNVADDTYMAAGSSITGQFNINSAVPADFTAPYTVNSATATFNFSDDFDLDYSYTTTGSYSYAGSSNYTRYRYNYYLDAADEVQVDIMGEVSTDGTSWFAQSNYTGQSYDGRSGGCGWFSCSYSYYYTYNYNSTSGYTGSFTIEQVLSDEARLALGDDGVVDFTVTATSGDIIFNNGNLSADVTANVPESGALALLSLGLLGLFVARRKV